jgi:hypothetical protein
MDLNASILDFIHKTKHRLHQWLSTHGDTNNVLASSHSIPSNLDEGKYLIIDIHNPLLNSSINESNLQPPDSKIIALFIRGEYSFTWKPNYNLRNTFTVKVPRQKIILDNITDSNGNSFKAFANLSYSANGRLHYAYSPAATAPDGDVVDQLDRQPFLYMNLYASNPTKFFYSDVNEDIKSLDSISIVRAAAENEGGAPLAERVTPYLIDYWGEIWNYNNEWYGMVFTNNPMPDSLAHFRLQDSLDQRTKKWHYPSYSEPDTPLPNSDRYIAFTRAYIDPSSNTTPYVYHGSINDRYEFFKVFTPSASITNHLSGNQHLNLTIFNPSGSLNAYFHFGYYYLLYPYRYVFYLRFRNIETTTNTSPLSTYIDHNNRSSEVFHTMLAVNAPIFTFFASSIGNQEAYSFRYDGISLYSSGFTTSATTYSGFTYDTNGFLFNPPPTLGDNPRFYYYLVGANSYYNSLAGNGTEYYLIRVGGAPNNPIHDVKHAKELVGSDIKGRKNSLNFHPNYFINSRMRHGKFIMLPPMFSRSSIIPHIWTPYMRNLRYTLWYSNYTDIKKTFNDSLLNAPQLYYSRMNNVNINEVSNVHRTGISSTIDYILSALNFRAINAFNISNTYVNSNFRMGINNNLLVRNNFTSNGRWILFTGYLDYWFFMPKTFSRLGVRSSAVSKFFRIDHDLFDKIPYAFLVDNIHSEIPFSEVHQVAFLDYWRKPNTINNETLLNMRRTLVSDINYLFNYPSSYSMIDPFEPPNWTHFNYSTVRGNYTKVFSIKPNYVPNIKNAYLNFFINITGTSQQSNVILPGDFNPDFYSAQGYNNDVPYYVYYNTHYFIYPSIFYYYYAHSFHFRPLLHWTLSAQEATNIFVVKFAFTSRLYLHAKGFIPVFDTYLDVPAANRSSDYFVRQSSIRHSDYQPSFDGVEPPMPIISGYMPDLAGLSRNMLSMLFPVEPIIFQYAPLVATMESQFYYGNNIYTRDWKTGDDFVEEFYKNHNYELDAIRLLPISYQFFSFFYPRTNPIVATYYYTPTNNAPNPEYTYSSLIDFEEATFEVSKCMHTISLENKKAFWDYIIIDLNKEHVYRRNSANQITFYQTYNFNKDFYTLAYKHNDKVRILIFASYANILPIVPKLLRNNGDRPDLPSIIKSKLSSGVSPKDVLLDIINMKYTKEVLESHGDRITFLDFPHPVESGIKVGSGYYSINDCTLINDTGFTMPYAVNNSHNISFIDTLNDNLLEYISKTFNDYTVNILPVTEEGRPNLGWAEALYVKINEAKVKNNFMGSINGSSYVISKQRAIIPEITGYYQASSYNHSHYVINTEDSNLPDWGKNTLYCITDYDRMVSSRERNQINTTDMWVFYFDRNKTYANSQIESTYKIDVKNNNLFTPSQSVGGYTAIVDNDNRKIIRANSAGGVSSLPTHNDNVIPLLSEDSSYYPLVLCDNPFVNNYFNEVGTLYNTVFLFSDFSNITHNPYAGFYHTNKVMTLSGRMWNLHSIAYVHTNDGNRRQEVFTSKTLKRNNNQHRVTLPPSMFMPYMSSYPYIFVDKNTYNNESVNPYNLMAFNRIFMPKIPVVMNTIYYTDELRGFQIRKNTIHKAEIIETPSKGTYFYNQKDNDLNNIKYFFLDLNFSTSTDNHINYRNRVFGRTFPPFDRHVYMLNIPFIPYNLTQGGLDTWFDYASNKNNIYPLVNDTPPEYYAGNYRTICRTMSEYDFSNNTFIIKQAGSVEVDGYSNVRIDTCYANFIPAIPLFRATTVETNYQVPNELNTFRFNALSLSTVENNRNYYNRIVKELYNKNKLRNYNYILYGYYPNAQLFGSSFSISLQLFSNMFFMQHLMNFDDFFQKHYVPPEILEDSDYINKTNNNNYVINSLIKNDNLNTVNRIHSESYKYAFSPLNIVYQGNNKFNTFSSFGSPFCYVFVPYRNEDLTQDNTIGNDILDYVRPKIDDNFSNDSISAIQNHWTTTYGLAPTDFNNWTGFLAGFGEQIKKYFLDTIIDYFELRNFSYNAVRYGALGIQFSKPSNNVKYLLLPFYLGKTYTNTVSYEQSEYIDYFYMYTTYPLSKLNLFTRFSIQDSLSFYGTDNLNKMASYDVIGYNNDLSIVGHILAKQDYEEYLTMLSKEKNKHYFGNPFFGKSITENISNLYFVYNNINDMINSGYFKRYSNKIKRVKVPICKRLSVGITYLGYNATHSYTVSSAGSIIGRNYSSDLDRYQGELVFPFHQHVKHGSSPNENMHLAFFNEHVVSSFIGLDSMPNLEPNKVAYSYSEWYKRPRISNKKPDNSNEAYYYAAPIYEGYITNKSRHADIWTTMNENFTQYYGVINLLDFVKGYYQKLFGPSSGPLTSGVLNKRYMHGFPFTNPYSFIASYYDARNFFSSVGQQYEQFILFFRDYWELYLCGYSELFYKLYSVFCSLERFLDYNSLFSNINNTSGLSFYSAHSKLTAYDFIFGYLHIVQPEFALTDSIGNHMYNEYMGLYKVYDVDSIRSNLVNFPFLSSSRNMSPYISEKNSTYNRYKYPAYYISDNSALYSGNTEPEIEAIWPIASYSRFISPKIWLIKGPVSHVWWFHKPISGNVRLNLNNFSARQVYNVEDVTLSTIYVGFTHNEINDYAGYFIVPNRILNTYPIIHPPSNLTGFQQSTFLRTRYRYLSGAGNSVISSLAPVINSWDQLPGSGDIYSFIALESNYSLFIDETKRAFFTASMPYEQNLLDAQQNVTALSVISRSPIRLDYIYDKYNPNAYYSYHFSPIFSSWHTSINTYAVFAFYNETSMSMSPSSLGIQLICGEFRERGGVINLNTAYVYNTIDPSFNYNTCYLLHEYLDSIRMSLVYAPLALHPFPHAQIFWSYMFPDSDYNTWASSSFLNDRPVPTRYHLRKSLFISTSHHHYFMKNSPYYIKSIFNMTSHKRFRWVVDPMLSTMNKFAYSHANETFFGLSSTETNYKFISLNYSMPKLNNTSSLYSCDFLPSYATRGRLACNSSENTNFVEHRIFRSGDDANHPADALVTLYYYAKHYTQITRMYSMANGLDYFEDNLSGATQYGAPVGSSHPHIISHGGFPYYETTILDYFLCNGFLHQANEVIGNQRRSARYGFVLPHPNYMIISNEPTYYKRSNVRFMPELIYSAPPMSLVGCIRLKVVNNNNEEKVVNIYPHATHIRFRSITYPNSNQGGHSLSTLAINEHDIEQNVSDIQQSFYWEVLFQNTCFPQTMFPMNITPTNNYDFAPQWLFASWNGGQYASLSYPIVRPLVQNAILDE